MIHTRLTEMFGLKYPIMSAPMALHSGGTLAAAVSKAGGLGSFGGIEPFKGAAWVREQIAFVRSQTNAPFAVGYISAFIPIFQACFDAAIDERVPVIALSFGSPQPSLEKAKAAGARVICQVQTLEHAQEAVAGGADVIVAQGNEAGGHTGSLTLLPLLSRVIDRFPETPVLAAGGIGNGRTLATVLAAGADGAWLGTSFLATPEAVEIPDAYKQLIVRSDGHDTVFTRVFDILSGLPWPPGIGARVRRNRLVDEWEGREAELPAQREKLAPAYNAARQGFDPEMMDVFMGQSAAFVDAVRPAATVIQTICDDAERFLRDQQSSVLK